MFINFSVNFATQIAHIWPKITNNNNNDYRTARRRVTCTGVAVLGGETGSRVEAAIACLPGDTARGAGGNRREHLHQVFCVYFSEVQAGFDANALNCTGKLIGTKVANLSGELVDALGSLMRNILFDSYLFLVKVSITNRYKLPNVLSKIRI